MGPARARVAARRVRAEARERIEPLAHALLEGEPAGTAARRDEQALTEILAELAPALTGESRDAIAGHFESSGAVTRVSRRLADPAPTAAPSTPRCSETCAARSPRCRSCRP